jgi:hypothetical protein
VRVSALGTQLLDGRPTFHAEVDNDELVYSTDEEVLALPLSGGTPRTRYTFRTSVDQPRAFATDGGDLYISEPPELIYLADGGTPTSIVDNMGAAITHIVARDGAAYWATLAVPESLGLLGTFSGGVMKVHRPCP